MLRVVAGGCPEALSPSDSFPPTVATSLPSETTPFTAAMATSAAPELGTRPQMSTRESLVKMGMTGTVVPSWTIRRPSMGGREETGMATTPDAKTDLLSMSTWQKGGVGLVAVVESQEGRAAAAGSAEPSRPEGRVLVLAELAWL